MSDNPKYIDPDEEGEMPDDAAQGISPPPKDPLPPPPPPLPSPNDPPKDDGAI